MKSYRGGRMFGGICQFVAVVSGIVVWVSVGLMNGFFGNASWFIGFLVGLIVTLPLYALAEALEAIFDIAENSHKLVDLFEAQSKEDKN